MKLPISWLKDYIDLEGLSIEEIARKLTLAGLEVDEIKYAGLPMPTYKDGERHEFKTSGIGWDRDKIVVAEIREVNPHPNADRLTLLDLYDGRKVAGRVDWRAKYLPLQRHWQTCQSRSRWRMLKKARPFTMATRMDLVLTTLKRAKIRGVDSYSMVASEKELGISEEHEGIIILDDDAPVGMPLVDYMGDAVLDISILPNMARNANVIGMARELSAITGRALKEAKIQFETEGRPVARIGIHRNYGA